MSLASYRAAPSRDISNKKTENTKVLGTYFYFFQTHHTRLNRDLVLPLTEV
jgi:hypothetical protein